MQRRGRSYLSHALKGDPSKLFLRIVVILAAIMLCLWFGKKMLSDSGNSSRGRHRHHQQETTRQNGKRKGQRATPTPPNGLFDVSSKGEDEDTFRGDDWNEDDEVENEGEATLKLRIKRLQQDIDRLTNSRAEIVAELTQMKRDLVVANNDRDKTHAKLDAAVKELTEMQLLADETTFLPSNISAHECVQAAEEDLQDHLRRDCSAFDIPQAVIPRTIHVVWKEEKMFREANLIDTVWRREEPCFRRHVVTDTECRALAGLYSKEMLAAFDRLPVEVMKADTCRVLAVYFHGGIYMDIDVAWAKPLREWFDISKNIIIAHETNNDYDDELETHHICNWFFAARAMHPCLRNVLELIRTRISKITVEDFANSPHLVHETTGPGAFTAGLKGCAVPSLTRKQVMTEYIYHHYGSQSWSKSGVFKSWVNERSFLQGWKLGLEEDVGEPFVQYAVESDPQYLLSAENRSLTTPQDPIVIISVDDNRLPEVTPGQFEWFYNAHNLFDGRLHTFYETPNPNGNKWSSAVNESASLAKMPQLTVIFKTAMPSPPATATATATAEATLGCVKLLARQDGDTETYRSIAIEALGEPNGNGKRQVIGSSTLDNGGFPFNSGKTQEPVLRFPVSQRTLGTHKIGGIQVSTVKNTSLPRFVAQFSAAELLFFRDTSCTMPIAVDVKDTTWPKTFFNRTADSTAAEIDHAEVMLRLAAKVSTPTYTCNNTKYIGRTLEGQSGWFVCWDAMQIGFRRGFRSVKGVDRKDAMVRKKKAPSPSPLTPKPRTTTEPTTLAPATKPCTVLVSGRHTGRFSFEDAFSDHMCRVMVIERQYSSKPTSRGKHITALGRQLRVEATDPLTFTTPDGSQIQSLSLQQQIKTVLGGQGGRGAAAQSLAKREKAQSGSADQPFVQSNAALSDSWVAKQEAKIANHPSLSLLKVDFEGREFKGGIAQLIKLAEKHLVDQVLVELRFYTVHGKVSETHEYLDALESLLKVYDLTAHWVNPHSSEEQCGTMTIKCCHRLTLVRKGLLPLQD